MTDFISGIDRRALEGELADRIRFEREASFRQLISYEPYPKQEDFHQLGATHRERLLMAGNQIGKSYPGSRETAYHVTGRYPKWWAGRRYDAPVKWWVAGIDRVQTRDNAQRLLFGEPGELGTGAIPLRDIVGEPTWDPQVRGLMDKVQIRHVSGGISHIQFKSYEAGKQKIDKSSSWGGTTIDGFWLDEEPPENLYAQALARTTARMGMVYITFTPERGATEVVEHFFPEPDSDQRAYVHMDITDALHIKPEDREAIIQAYPEHERDARAHGMPMMGEGLVFPIARSLIQVPEVNVGRTWRRVAGIDFGYNHPTAVAWCATDPVSGNFYVYDVYRQRQAHLSVHADAIKARGDWIPVAWPKDGHRGRDGGEGISMVRQYRERGVKMMGNHAQERYGKTNLESTLMEMTAWMQAGRFKVAAHLGPFWDEMRSYHRKAGKVVDRHDDVLSAARYAFMMRDAGQVEPIAYDSSGDQQDLTGTDWDPMDGIPHERHEDHWSP